MQGRDLLNISDPSELKKIRYEDGRERVLADYANNDAASLVTRKDGSKTVWGLAYLDRFFADRAVVDINAALLQRFVEQRQHDGASNATINRNLALLRRMLNLLAREHDIRVPHFPHLKESEPRQGFLEPRDFAKLIRELPERLRCFILFLYVTGCRTGEAKSLCWNQVDWNERVIRVQADQTKNRVSRSIPVSDEVLAYLRKTPEAKRVGLLFPVGCFRKAWQSACVRAELGKFTKGPQNGGYGIYQGLIPHDLRRSAVRNLRRDGVGENLAMSISGHKTAEVFRRYDIVSNEEKLEAVRAIGSSLGQVLKRAKVVK